MLHRVSVNTEVRYAQDSAAAHSFAIWVHYDFVLHTKWLQIEVCLQTRHRISGKG
jgi:hypothetical protein